MTEDACQAKTRDSMQRGRRSLRRDKLFHAHINRSRNMERIHRVQSPLPSRSFCVADCIVKRGCPESSTPKILLVERYLVTPVVKRRLRQHLYAQKATGNERSIGIIEYGNSDLSKVWISKCRRRNQHARIYER